MDSINSLNSLFTGVTVKDGQVAVARDEDLASPAMDRLVRAAKQNWNR